MKKKIKNRGIYLRILVCCEDPPIEGVGVIFCRRNMLAPMRSGVM